MHKNSKEKILRDGLYSSIDFVEDCTDEELEPLVKILTDCSTSELSNKEAYIEHSPNHNKYINEIIDDYERFGGNTIANLWRGYGVGYKEILGDVCDQMKVSKPNDCSLNGMELALITKITEDAINKMSTKELEGFAKAVDPQMTDFSRQAVTIAARLAINKAGFTAYKLLTQIIHAVGTKILGKTVPWVIYQTSTKWLSVFAGPVGLALTSAWTFIDIAGPAYRVTIPATIYIASLRQAKLHEISHK